MSSNEQLFENYYYTLLKQMDLAVIFYANYKYCIAINYLENPDFAKNTSFIDSFRLSNSISLISQVNKVLIKSKNAFAFIDLVDLVDKNPQIFGKSKEFTNKIIADIQIEYKELENVINRLTIHRHNFHSHLGKTYSQKGLIYSIFTDYFVEFNEIEHVFDFLCRSIFRINFIMNEYFSSRNIQCYLQNKDSIYSLTDLESVFERLKN